MGLSLKPQHLKRYKDVAVLLMKYGRSDLVKAAGLDPTLDDEGPAGTPTDAAASELANDLERMGPTFIKLGQLLSTRPDILPLAVSRRAHAAAGSTSSPSPSPRSSASSSPSSACGSRRRSPSSSATPSPPPRSVRCTEPSCATDAPVAVKVQRPDIRERVMEDLDALEEIAEFLDHHTEMGRRYGFAQHRSTSSGAASCASWTTARRPRI